MTHVLRRLVTAYLAALEALSEASVQKVSTDRYDVIWENPAHVGTQRTGSDHTPRVLRGV